MRLGKYFGKIDTKIPKKKFVLFFLIILIPNILRQAIYYYSYLNTRSVDFIASFETKAIYSSNVFFTGVLEEVAIGLVFAFFWFKFRKLKFFSYGWVSDALIDFIFVGIWFLVGGTPLQLLGLGDVPRFILREIVFSYGTLGLILYRMRADLKKVSFIVTLVGLLVLILI